MGWEHKVPSSLRGSVGIVGVLKCNSSKVLTLFDQVTSFVLGTVVQVLGILVLAIKHTQSLTLFRILQLQLSAWRVKIAINWLKSIRGNTKDL